MGSVTDQQRASWREAQREWRAKHPNGNPPRDEESVPTQGASAIRVWDATDCPHWSRARRNASKQVLTSFEEVFATVAATPMSSKNLAEAEAQLKLLVSHARRMRAEVIQMQWAHKVRKAKEEPVG